MQAIGVFLAMFALDFIWAEYTYAMTKRMACRAGLFASAIIVLGGSAAIAYTSKPIMLIPAMLGAFAGTYAAVKRE
jgi:Na+-transporting NADH:ubiquinone oxidoreductase subunit NqrD